MIRREFGERLVEGENVNRVVVDALRGGVQRDTGQVTSAFCRRFPAGVVNEHMPQSLRGDGKEMCLVLPVTVVGLSEAHVCFMH